MLKTKLTSFTLTGRFLVIGAVFLFVLLVVAAAVTNTMGLDARDRLSDAVAVEQTLSAEDQAQQIESAIGVLTLQRWITSLALGAAVFILGLTALLLHLNVRRPLRKLSENLENLLADEEDWSLPGTERNDEIGMVARVAEDLRRTQLQAGRLLTVGVDGALRLRLEGSGAEAVDAALAHITEATEDLRGSARALSDSRDGLAGESREAMARIETALDEAVAGTAGRLEALAAAGDEVRRVAGDLEGTRHSLAETEGSWRGDMTELAEAMRGELDRLSATSERLAESTATAGARVTHATQELSDFTETWRNEQHAINTSTAQAREELTAHLSALDGQIGTLDQALGRLRQLADRAGPPMEGAMGALDKAVKELNLTGKTAQAATVLMAKEAEAARNTRLAVMSEAQADRAHWQSERGELRDEATNMIAQLGETAARVDSLANALGEESEGLPGKLERMTGELADLKAQIEDFKASGGSVAEHLNQQLAAIQSALGEAQAAFIGEANVIRGVTTNLSDMHMTFEHERRAVSDQVETLAYTLKSLDAQLASINQSIELPLDLSPVLGALRDEMGQAVTHLTRAVEDQALTSQRSLSNAVYQLGQKIDSQNGSFEHVIATGLLDLSDRLNTKITAQNEAAGELTDALENLQTRLAEVPQVPVGGEAEIIPPTDVTALLDPRIDRLDETGRQMAVELRALAKAVAARDAGPSPALAEQIARVEALQGSMGDAQEAMALALRDGLRGIARRLKTTDVSGVRLQLDEMMETLVRHQDRLSGIMRDTSADLKTRIDGLSGQIARGGKVPPRKSFFGQSVRTPATGASQRVSQTPPPENELSAIHDALRGLTDELKGLSAEEGSANPEAAPDEPDNERRNAG